MQVGCRRYRRASDRAEVQQLTTILAALKEAQDAAEEANKAHDEMVGGRGSGKSTCPHPPGIRCDRGWMRSCPDERAWRRPGAAGPFRGSRE